MGLGLAYSTHNDNARNKLLTTCQHWKHNITCLSDWTICRCHSQMRHSSCPNLSCDQFSQSCSAGGKIAPGVYTLPHKIIVTGEIIFFVYVAWRKICTVSFSCSLKMFGWRWNSSRSGYFASWGKIDTAWVIQKISDIGNKNWKASVSAQKKLNGWALFASPV